MERQKRDLVFCQRKPLEHQNSKTRWWSATKDCRDLQRQRSARDQAAASGNCTRSSRRGGSPARMPGLPVGPILKDLHVTQGTMKEHDIENLFHIFFPLKFFVSHENRVISHVGEPAFIYSPSKVEAFQAPSHSLLPWKWPLCHKQAPVFTGRDSRSEWILKWVKALVFMYFLLLIKHKRAQILHTQLKFKTISNLSFPDTHLPSSFSQSPVKKARKNVY